MTPEERQRTMDFIVASQARLAAAQEQDRHDRLEFDKWSKGQTDITNRLLIRTTELLNIQPQRMDRLDKFYEDALRQNDSFQKQVLPLLNMILDRLPKPDLPS